MPLFTDNQSYKTPRLLFAVKLHLIRRLFGGGGLFFAANCLYYIIIACIILLLPVLYCYCLYYIVIACIILLRIKTAKSLQA